MKKKLLTILLVCSLSVGVVACGNKNSNNNDTSTKSETPKTSEDTKDNQSDEKNETEDFNDSNKTDESKSFDGLIDFLVSKGYITKEGDGGSFAEGLGAINGYRYYNLETLETTEIYEFSPEKDMSNLSLSGMEVTPNKIIGTYAIFSKNEELIRDIEEYLK